ncbi:hypothetical protein TWF225_005450 [Orbilia oligospora]|nr:hypothetical protein TWF225_005450 [Orbilia oligospora]KAF3259919.1 hypothetical protein TWF128_003908 [Orbilia oligospora]KAF3270774.1 hypothetical protein TWF217_007048 [Orbilia oligospora]KAF3292261.1 hypothetical protein TWF132_005650 [Orbilia oligospora]
MALNTLQLACATTPLITITILSLPTTSLIRQILYPLPALLFLQTLISPPKFPSSDIDAIQEAFKLGTLYASFGFAFCHYLYAYGYNTPKYFYKLKRINKSNNDENGGVNDTKEKVEVFEREEYPENSWWGRVKWSLSLITALRGIGWNFQISSLPETKYPSSKGACIRQTAVTIILAHVSWFTAGAICGFIARILRDPEFAGRYSLLHSLFGNVLVQMAVVSGAWGIRNIAFTVLLSSYLKIIFVGLEVGGGWGDIKQWPRMFGYFEDCWSVKSVWGKVWHQSIRKCIQVPGDKIADMVFGAEPKSLPYPIQLLRRVFLLFSAFSISGFIHASGSYFIVVGTDYTQPPGKNPPWYYTFLFFISQALFIIVEEVVFWALGVSNTGVEVKKSKTRWLFGIGYTTLWFIWCTPVLWADPESRVVGFMPLGMEGEGYAHVFDRIDRF